MPRQTTKRQVSITRSIPAPVGGLNAVDAIAEMPETDAVVLDNWFPRPSDVLLRSGYTAWKTGFTHWVESLMPYSNATGEKLFAASGTAFYDATASGAVGGAVVTGLTNARWESTNVATPGGQFLYAANAVDPPELYDGTTWVAITAISTPAITGVTTTKLRCPTVWKNRVWFIENASLNAWYLPTQSVGGLAAKWDLGTIFRLGGTLATICTASISTSSTFDDYIAFVTTEGEVAVYAGTDPAQAGLFVLQGVYRIGKTVGRRCFFKSGADTILICSDGLVSLSRLVTEGRGKKEETISYKIMNDINNAVALYKNNFGWQGVLHPLGNKIIVNVPTVEDARSYQYVMNTINGSWCTFGRLDSPWNAACFAVLGDSLYFGSGTFVAQADTGQSDNLTVITGSCLPAFSYFKSDRNKFFTGARIIFNSDGPVMPAVALNTDFNIQAPTGFLSYNNAGGSPWNTSPWNTSPWSSTPAIRTGWQTVTGIGFTASMYFKVSTLVDQIAFYSTDYLYQPGGVY